MDSQWLSWSVHLFVNQRRDLLSFSIQINKEIIETYSENTDEPLRRSFDLFVQLPVHVVNLLPIAVSSLFLMSRRFSSLSLSFKDVEQVLLQPTDVHHSPSAHKTSRLRFLVGFFSLRGIVSHFIAWISSYNNATWLSEEIDLDGKGQKGHDAITGESLVSERQREMFFVSDRQREDIRERRRSTVFNFFGQIFQ
jgi:hypothetical protein